jgi:lipid-A-disaccharide synthase
MLDTARLLKNEGKIASAEVTKVAHLATDIYTEYINGADEFITLVDKPLHELLPTYDAVLVASGTATLETGYYCVPMVIVYQVNKLTYRLGKWMIKLDFIGLVNIVSEKQVARELIQHEFTPEIAAHELELLLIPEKNVQVRDELMVVREKLGEPGASNRAAHSIWDFIKLRDQNAK